MYHSKLYKNLLSKLHVQADNHFPWMIKCYCLHKFLLQFLYFLNWVEAVRSEISLACWQQIVKLRRGGRSFFFVQLNQFAAKTDEFRTSTVYSVRVSSSWGSRSNPFFCDFPKNSWLLQQFFTLGEDLVSFPLRKCILLWPCLQYFTRYDKKYYQNYCRKNSQMEYSCTLFLLIQLNVPRQIGNMIYIH